MKIDVVYGKQKQFFLYIYHLSGWHFSAYKELADLYIEQTGSITAEEKSALKIIKQIFKKHDFTDSYVGIAYMDYADAEVDDVLKKLLGKEDFITYQTAVTVLSPRLERIWQMDEVRLSKIAGKVATLVTQKKYQKLLDQIDQLFGPIPNSLRLVVLVLPQAFSHMGGSANTAPTTAVIELAKVTDVSDAVLVAFHELLHCLIKQKNLSFSVSKPVNQTYKQNIPFFTEMSKSESVEELFLRFFLPDGYLARSVNKTAPLDKYINFVPPDFHDHIQKVIKDSVCISQQDVDLLKKSIV